MRTRVGYAGGTLERPTYHKLGDHTETTELDFDPAKVTFAQLVEMIWGVHNPCSTSYSRQYMSAFFYHNDEQKKIIDESKAKLEKKLGRKVQTAILPHKKFWLAEDYHQKFSLRHDEQLLKEFKAFYPDEKDFVNSTAAARVNAYIAGNGKAEQFKTELESLGLSPEGRKRLQSYVK